MNRNMCFLEATAFQPSSPNDEEEEEEFTSFLSDQ